jgi:hypothetical protein
MSEALPRLLPLIRELRELPDWPETRLPVGLLLYDVLSALGASDGEMDGILGGEMLVLIGRPSSEDAGRAPSSGNC